ncbi:hypothetical protein TNCV_2829121 [Trichonephila clavipes]|nr:hypothetical protein TNCV_2829121 [Trichonephila clavipes]
MYLQLFAAKSHAIAGHDINSRTQPRGSVRWYIISNSGGKISQRLPGLETLREKKSVVSFEDLLSINGTKYSAFQEAARAAGLSKSEDFFINEVLNDAVSVMNLNEEERQERILRKKEQINRTR